MHALCIQSSFRAANCVPDLMNNIIFTYPKLKLLHATSQGGAKTSIIWLVPKDKYQLPLIHLISIRHKFVRFFATSQPFPSTFLITRTTLQHCLEVSPLTTETLPYRVAGATFRAAISAADAATGPGTPRDENPATCV